MDEGQGGQISSWKSGFVGLCQMDERRTAECRVVECLGTRGAILTVVSRHSSNRRKPCCHFVIVSSTLCLRADSSLVWILRGQHRTTDKE